MEINTNNITNQKHVNFGKIHVYNLNKELVGNFNKTQIGRFCMIENPKFLDDTSTMLNFLEKFKANFQDLRDVYKAYGLNKKFFPKIVNDKKNVKAYFFTGKDKVIYETMLKKSETYESNQRIERIRTNITKDYDCFFEDLNNPKSSEDLTLTNCLINFFTNSVTKVKKIFNQRKCYDSKLREITINTKANELFFDEFLPKNILFNSNNIKTSTGMINSMKEFQTLENKLYLEK